jgi:hypothetical protein
MKISTSNLYYPFSDLPKEGKSRGKRRIRKIQNPWESYEYGENPMNTIGIPYIRWESHEYGENLMNTVGIP